MVNKNKTHTVGVIIPSIGVRFFDYVMESIDHAEQRLKPFGLKIIRRSMQGIANAEEQVRLINEIADNIQALIITPITDTMVTKRLNELIEQGVFIITLNNDLLGLARHVYVGTDFKAGGRTAGGMMHMIGSKNLHIGVLIGSKTMLSNIQRLEGFQEGLASRGRAEDSWEIVDVMESNDDDMTAYENVQQHLKEHPETNAIFVITSGAAYGAAKAVKDSGRKGEVTLIVFDIIPNTLRMMKEGVVQAAIYQHPHIQGRTAMQIAFEYLINNKYPDNYHHIIRNDIRILENAED